MEDGAADASREEEVDMPMCLAEFSALLLGILGSLILLSGLGFWTVDPPGEDDLCRVNTLGLQNKTEDEQNMALGACHGLYATVFNSLHVISVPFILCGVFGLLSFYNVVRGACARDENKTPGHFRCGICSNIAGLVMVAIPSMVFPTVSGVVGTFLAPLHAYYITMMVAHGAVVLSGAASKEDQDEGVRTAMKDFETFYAGYCAASRTELCLFIGSTCMLVLLGTYIFDIIRAIGALSCYPPDYNLTTTCQLARAHRLCRNKKDQLQQQYNKVGN